MRISGVTGDLPAVAALPEAPPVPPAPVEAPPAVAAPAASSEANAGHERHDPPGQRVLLHAFDPPLIAQRAALGLPVGMLISELAQAEGITYNAACALVDGEMPGEGGGD